MSVYCNIRAQFLCALHQPPGTSVDPQTVAVREINDMMVSRSKAEFILQLVQPVHISRDSTDFIVSAGSQDLVQISFYIACVDQHVDRCFLPDRPAHEIVMSVGITQYQNLHFLSVVLLYDEFTCNGYEAGSIRNCIFRPLSFYTQWGRPPLIETGAFPTEMITKSGCSLSAAMGRRDESIIFIPDKT